MPNTKHDYYLERIKFTGDMTRHGGHEVTMTVQDDETGESFNVVADYDEAYELATLVSASKDGVQIASPSADLQAYVGSNGAASSIHQAFILYCEEA